MAEPIRIPGLSPGLSTPVAGLEAATTLTPVDIMHRMGEQWRYGASAAEKAETLRVILKNDRFPASLLRALEGEMGERVLTVPTNKIPRSILKLAGSPKRQAKFTQTLEIFRVIKKGPPSPNVLRKTFGLAMRAAQQADLPPKMMDAFRRMGAAAAIKAGPTSVARIYDIATKESGARRLWRWATKGDPVLSGKKALGTGPLQSLTEGVRKQIDDLEGAAKQTISEKVGAAKGVFGKGQAAVKGAGEALSPKGFTAAEQGTLSQLTKAGAKGLGRGARFARAAGGLGGVAGVGFIGYELYDSLVGKSKRARAALEASRTGGTASVSQELMYDILDKRADLQARRAMLGRDPQLMQQIVQSLGGSNRKTLTKSEVGFGVDSGPAGTSPEQMDKLLEQLLGQMRGM